MTASDPDGRAPKGYRFLFTTYPRTWRDQHADVVLGTLLEVHAASGRSRLSLRERLGFAVDGLRYRARAQFATPPARRFADVAALHDFHAFDQTNGRTPAERSVSALEQTRANRPMDRDNDEDRTGALAWSAFNIPR